MLDSDNYQNNSQLVHHESSLTRWNKSSTKNGKHIFFSKNMLRETRAQLISQWAKLAKSEKFEMISFKDYIFIQLEQSSSKHFLYSTTFESFEATHLLNCSLILPTKAIDLTSQALIFSVILCWMHSIWVRRYFSWASIHTLACFWSLWRKQSISSWVGSTLKML